MISSAVARTVVGKPGLENPSILACASTKGAIETLVRNQYANRSEPNRERLQTSARNNHPPWNEIWRFCNKQANAFIEHVFRGTALDSSTRYSRVVAKGYRSDTSLFPDRDRMTRHSYKARIGNAGPKSVLGSFVRLGPFKTRPGIHLVV
ncbi:MAG TPA: hypothetical protein VHZ07_07570 [Bryobacteraceae bacterium]|nr:hypothetical protein [Bryobacteraceae bacterium]